MEEWKTTWQEKTVQGNDVVAMYPQCHGEQLVVVRFADGHHSNICIDRNGKRISGACQAELVPVTPPLRPMTRQEIAALGFVWVRRKGSPTWGRIVWLDNGHSGVQRGESVHRVSDEDLARDYEHSLDGREWLPFATEAK